MRIGGHVTTWGLVRSHDSGGVEPVGPNGPKLLGFDGQHFVFPDMTALEKLHIQWP